MERSTANTFGKGTVVIAAVFAIAVLASIFFIWRPGTEIADPNTPVSQAVNSNAQTTTNLNGDTLSNEKSAPPDSNGAGPPTAKP
ncbi:MAG TPA: hypothetical protein VHT51_14615 [Micropepsaceae bacterium]|jgi:hypothetical protein|nr:hypothetical protein [Micropepsaceae bacterium]